MRLVYVALAFCAGIFAARSFPSFFNTISLLLMIAAVIVLLASLALKRYRLLAVCALIFALGTARMTYYPLTSSIAVLNNSGGMTIEGVVVDAPDVRDDRIDLRVEAEIAAQGGHVYQVSGLVLVRAPRHLDVRYGDRIRATGRITQPAVYDTFSYADYLARSGVFSLLRDTSVEVLSSGHGSPLSQTLIDARTAAADLIAAYLPEPQAGLLTGILLGSERGISPALSDDFAATGAAHVVAISGFNMVIVSGVVMGILKRITSRTALPVIITLMVIMIYTVFVGANAAVIRAALMSGLLLVGGALRRRTYAPASLAFAALLLAVANPLVLWDLSFQLSFAATLGLALFADPLQAAFERGLYRMLPRKLARRLIGVLSEPIIVTLAAMTLTTPLIALYFGRFSLVTLPVNLLIVPVQSFILIFGALALFSALVWPLLSQVLFWSVMVLLTWTIEIVRRFAALPFADVELSLSSRWVSLIFLCVLGWAILEAKQPAFWERIKQVMRQRTLAVGVLSALAIAGVLIWWAVFSRPDGRLHLYFLNLGHTNTVFIQTPNGAQILIDGGRYPSRLLTAIGDRMPYYDRQIETVLITKPDPWDTDALVEVFERYTTPLVLTNGQPNMSPNYASLQDALGERAPQPLIAGQTITTDDGVTLEVLNPQTTPALKDRYGESSLVMRLSYGDFSVLLMSDATASAQAAMLEAGANVRADVMQLPDHATAGSLMTDFVAEVQPEAVILQFDPANLRGDPDVDVLARVAGIDLYSTDTHGTIHLWTDGLTWQAEGQTW